MINITVRPKSYSRDELKEMFSRYSTADSDFNEFMAAMLKTDQLEERKGGYFPTAVSVSEKATKQYREYNTILYGGKKRAKYQRVAIRALKSDTSTDPTKMHITSYQDKKGNWHRVSELPSLTLAAPRKYERWRANIPSDIARKYGIRSDTPIRVRIEGVTKRYFSQLSLWGYEIRGMISFGETHGHKEDRHLELRTDNFQFEVKGPLRDDMRVAGEKLLSITRKWLDTYDKEYSAFFDRSIVNEEGPHKGIDYAVPLTKAPSRRQATIEFEDLDRGRIIASAEATPARNWTEKDDGNTVGSFFLSRDDVVHGYKGRDRTFRKKEGTTKSTPYTKTKQAILNLSNTAGFRKKR
jgi:hypothetical protein